MKSKTKIFAVILLIGFIGILFFKKNIPAKDDAVQKSKIIQSEKLIEQAKSHPGLTQSNLSASENSSECKFILESIETLPLQTLIYDLTNGNLDINSHSNCIMNDFPKLKNLDGFPAVCQIIKGTEPSKKCIDQLFKYKSLRIHHATLNSDIDLLDTPVIIQKFMAVLSDDSTENPEGQNRIRTIGQKLYERLPNSEAAVKAAVLGFMIPTNLSTDDQQKFNDILDSARSKFPNNWEIYEMDLIRKKGQSLDSFKNEIQNYYAKYPNSAIAQYYMGCLNWSENNAPVARDFLKSATVTAPNDPRFADTYQQAQKLNPPEKICMVQINLSPDDF